MSDKSASTPKSDDDEPINVRFHYGSIVVAKLGSYPWWPAMVDPCPETNDIYWLDNYEDLSKKNASHYHVVFFDVPGKVTRSWVHTSKIVNYKTYFPEPLTDEQKKAVKNLKKSASKRRIIEARSTAEAALLLSIEERRKKFSFLYTFKGKITLFARNGVPVGIRKKPGLKLNNITPKAVHEDGNKHVFDGAKVGDDDNDNERVMTVRDDDSDAEEAQKVEPLKIKKKPGPKRKKKTSAETPEKVEPLRIRKKPGPKPKSRSLPNNEDSTFSGEWTPVVNTAPSTAAVSAYTRRVTFGCSTSDVQDESESENEVSGRGEQKSKSERSVSTIEDEELGMKNWNQNGLKRNRMMESKNEEKKKKEIMKKSEEESQQERANSSVTPSRYSLEMGNHGIRLLNIGKVEPLKIRKKPGPKPKRSQTDSDNVDSEFVVERSSSASNTSSIIFDSDVTPPRKTQRSRLPPRVPPVSQSPATPACDSDVTPPKKAQRSLLPPQTPSQLSAKPASAPRATTELEQELSVFAASYPVEQISPPFPGFENSGETPKKRSRKRKTKAKSLPLYSKKRGRPSKKLPVPESTDEGEESLEPTSSVSAASTALCRSPVSSTLSPEPVTLPTRDPSADSIPLRLTGSESENAPDLSTSSMRLEFPPSAPDMSFCDRHKNSIENQITSVLNRLQKQPSSNIKSTGRTISNLNLLVAKTEEGCVIDLTGEDFQINEESKIIIDLTLNDDDTPQKFRYGDVVYAHLKGLMPWPAIVVMDSQINLCFIPENGTPNFVHVFFLDLNRRAWVPVENVVLFNTTLFRPEEPKMLNYEKYRRAVRNAQQISGLTREERILRHADMKLVPMTGAGVAP